MKIAEDLGWKVLRVRLDTGARTSVFAITGAVVYPQGWRTTPLPGCGPITLFRTYAQAKDFTGLMSQHEVKIVPVKYEPWDTDMAAVLDYSLWQPVEGKSVRGSGISRYVKSTVTRNRVKVGVRRNHDLPKGTVLASAVTCLE